MPHEKGVELKQLNDYQLDQKYQETICSVLTLYSLKFTFANQNYNKFAKESIYLWKKNTGNLVVKPIHVNIVEVIFQKNEMHDSYSTYRLTAIDNSNITQAQGKYIPQKEISCISSSVHNIELEKCIQVASLSQLHRKHYNTSISSAIFCNNFTFVITPIVR